VNKLLTRVRFGLKTFSQMVFGRPGTWWGTRLGGTRLNYAASVADGRGNAIIMAVGFWLARTFPEAPLRVLRKTGAELEPVADHQLTQLLRVPNPFYSGLLLWFATLLDWLITGNAYWLKVRSGGGRVVQLWWVPSFTMEPAWPDDGRTFISHYDYTPGTQVPIKIAPADVVHFRYGLDPNNVRKGLSPIGSLLREIFTDDEAANTTAAILRNMGVPGVVLSPDGKDDEINGPDAEEMKTEFQQRFGGDMRGTPMVTSLPIKVTQLGFSPEQMNLRSLRRIPEERVTAILGVPAVVVGLGAGLDRSTFANYSQAREAAYESNIIPTQRLFAEELRTQLLGDFDDPNRTEIDFDLAKVRVLQDDQNALHERAREDVKAGLITLNQGLAMIGEEQLPGDTGDIRYIPISVTPTAGDALLPPEPAPVPPALSEPGTQPPQLRSIAAELKSPAQFAPGVLRIRARLTPALATETERFLHGQRDRVLRALRAALKDVADDDVFNADAESELLRKLLEPWYSRALESVADLSQAALGISFEIDDPLVRAYLRASGAKITLISETTRQAVRNALVAGQAEGESYQQLASRIRDLPEFDRPRALMVARTELGESTIKATVLSHTVSGVVVGEIIHDGSDFDEPCAVRNGKRITLAEAAGVGLLHPNCTMSLAPITDARELRSATNGHVKELAGVK
jgi:HK97 family phage portal protein